MIKNIRIKNVRGIGSLQLLDLNLKPNRPALFVAPNGFGKSSFTTAFTSLNRNRVDLMEEHLHAKLSTNKPEVSIDFEAAGNLRVLTADENKNEIGEVFNVVTITSLARAKGTRRNNGGFTTVSAAYVIDPITLVSTIPKKAKFDYAFASAKETFGKAGKVIPNLGQICDDPAFFSTLYDTAVADAFKKTHQKKQQDQIAAILQRVDAQITNETAPAILAMLKVSELPNFRKIEHLKVVADHIFTYDFCQSDELQSYLIAVQLSLMYMNKMPELKLLAKYSDYLLIKRSMTKVFADFNTTWKEFKPKEKNGALVLEFPELHHISNGQRDVMAFVAELQKAKFSLKSKALLLVIDEVFDYLDEANLVAVQYYVSRFIEEAKSKGLEIYPVIMTHLSPDYFTSYVFGARLKIQLHYLKKYPHKVQDAMKKLLRERGNPLSPLKAPIEKQLLHFDPSPANVRQDFLKAGLKETWGEPGVFYKAINAEVAKYLAGAPDYDPLAVCCAVRVQIEKTVYDLITDPAKKSDFVSVVIDGTRSKLDFAVELGLTVPDAFYLLGVVYNEGLHWREDDAFVSKTVTRLQNITITGMIKALFV